MSSTRPNPDQVPEHGQPEREWPEHGQLEREQPEHGPDRRCAVTGERRPKKALMRFALDPAGMLVEDLAGRLPGRGVHVIPEPQAVLALIKRVGRLEKLFSRPVQVPSAQVLLPRLAGGFARRLGEGIGLAKRAGELRMGVLGLEELLHQGHRPLVLLAADTAAHTRQKVTRLLYRKDGPPGGRVLEVLDRDAFGALFQRGPVAVLAVVPGALARRLEEDGQKWQLFSDYVRSTGGPPDRPAEKMDKGGEVL